VPIVGANLYDPVLAAWVLLPQPLGPIVAQESLQVTQGVNILLDGIFTGFGAKVTGGNMESGGIGRMDFELDSMSKGFGSEVEELLNARLAEDRPVHVLVLSRAEALADPDLIRTKVNLIPASVDPIRIVDIEGIDKQADGGTHVRSTGEVGRVRVVKTESKGKANKRMRIQLDA